MRSFNEYVDLFPETVKKYGLRQPGTCTRCNTEGTVVLGSTICADCYPVVISNGGKTSRRNAPSTASSAKKLAVRLALDGSASIAELEREHGALVAGVILTAIVGKGWAVEDEESDQLRPTGKLPPGRASEEARRILSRREEEQKFNPATPEPLNAEMVTELARRSVTEATVTNADVVHARALSLVDYVNASGGSSTRAAAMDVLDLRQTSFARALEHAKALGLISTRRGQGGGLVAPECVPVAARNPRVVARLCPVCVQDFHTGRPSTTPLTSETPALAGVSL